MTRTPPWTVKAKLHDGTITFRVTTEQRHWVVSGATLRAADFPPNSYDASLAMIALIASMEDADRLSSDNALATRSRLAGDMAQAARDALATASAVVR